MADYDHELKIIGGGGWTDYTFEAIGFITSVKLNEHDEVGDKHVKGQVGGGEDVIGFNGAPKGIKFPNGMGDCSLKLDGNPVEPFHLNMRTIEIQTPSDKAPYEFAVSGRVIGSESTNSSDVVFDGGKRARGSVMEYSDKWHFSGALTAWPDSNQPLKVTVDNKVYEYDGNPPVGAI